MGELLAGVAHELNNPLAVVTGRAYLLGAALAGSPLAPQIDKLGEAAERCARIVKNFLAMARQRPPERREVRLDEVVHDALELLAYALRVDDVQVTLALAADVPVLWADPHQLHQVVLNLVTNAHQAMRDSPGPRRVTLATAFDASRGQVTLEISDSGPGIPAAVQARLFEPFFTTKPVGQGTGLGLSLCQGIVEGHGGTIGVTSTPGEGTVVRVVLPVTARPAGAAPAGPEPVQAAPRGKRILVVDDEQEVAHVLAAMLALDGHVVEVAPDGVAALDRIREAPFDVVMSDLRMPRLDGPGLYRRLQELRHPLVSRFVFLSGDVLSPETRAFVEETPAASIAKPFSLQDVRRVVSQVLSTSAAWPPGSGGPVSTQALVLQEDAEVHAVRPQGDVVAVGQLARPEGRSTPASAA